MKLTNSQEKQIFEEVISRLQDMIRQVEQNGFCGISFENVDPEDFLSEAADALASGDMLQCVIMDTMSYMDEFQSTT